MTKPTYESLCPFCGATAQYQELDHGERHYYKCPACTKFIVTEMAEKRLREAGLQPELGQQARQATDGNDERVLEVSYGYSNPDPFGFRVEVVDKSRYPSL